MSVCDRIIAPADPGDYTLHVTQDGTIDTVRGVRALNGQEVETWTHEDLVVNGPQQIRINPDEEHIVQVFGTFGNDDTFTVELKLNEATVATCTLTRDGDTISSMSLITRAED